MTERRSTPTDRSPERAVTDLTPSRQLIEAIAIAADDRQAGDIAILDVSNVSYLADYFAIVTGFSKAQVRAIADAIEKQVAAQCGQNPLRVEGKTEGSWVVLDYGDAIAHIMLPSEREFYSLEAFWGHAERLELPVLLGD
ncbi:MAG: ribosome silencing factor [Spirulinaceae cyanobacterium SM2_1_0]|nr:ribosome silencing factor [Spirulinaceae cyanobacterium SM2_1_0]